ncbi:MAG: viperin family antiviral radical SAM protein, partial [Candidatus Heimdallarchaeaceae archaeon]
ILSYQESKAGGSKMINSKSYSHSFSYKPISVNWHLWPRCNYNCKFCFGRFNEIRYPLSKKQALKIPALLEKAGTNKLSFTGGEPLLCPYLGDLIIESKQLGLTTMLITNASLLSEEFLYRYHNYIDWIALSIDSADENIQKKLGRGFGCHVRNIKKISKKIQEYNISLKINTVITKLNCDEDMHELIAELKPIRWKVFQVLPIGGQNEGKVESLLISEEEFTSFVQKHIDLNPIAEKNEYMMGSYLMLDAKGRFFQNTKGHLEYSDSILRVGVNKALNQVGGWDTKRFIQRGGLYNWRREN